MHATSGTSAAWHPNLLEQFLDAVLGGVGDFGPWVSLEVDVPPQHHLKDLLLRMST